jgi:hypothetical protein
MSAVVANLLSRLNDEVSVTVLCAAIVAEATRAQNRATRTEPSKGRRADQPQWRVQVRRLGPWGTFVAVAASTHPRVNTPRLFVSLAELRSLSVMWSSTLTVRSAPVATQRRTIGRLSSGHRPRSLRCRCVYVCVS